MKIKTSELQGAALDWAVEAAKEVQFMEGRVVKICRQEATMPAWIEVENYPGSAPIFHRSTSSTDWSQGGPIIDREEINTVRCNDLHFPKGNEHGEYVEQYWRATKPQEGLPPGVNGGYTMYGPTPLIAAMRCFVASRLGESVDVPEEFVNV